MAITLDATRRSILRAHIRGLALEGARVRVFSRTAPAPHAGVWTNARRVLRGRARDTGLLYAFLRGVPYRAAEWTARYAPDAKWLAAAFRGAFPWDHRDPTADVAAWLAVPPTPEMLAGRDAAAARGRELRSAGLKRARAEREASCSGST